jgi:hypothetical protein
MMNKEWRIVTAVMGSLLSVSVHAVNIHDLDNGKEMCYNCVAFVGKGG